MKDPSLSSLNLTSNGLSPKLKILTVFLLRIIGLKVRKLRIRMRDFSLIGVSGTWRIVLLIRRQLGAAFRYASSPTKSNKSSTKSSPKIHSYSSSSTPSNPLKTVSINTPPSSPSPTQMYFPYRLRMLNVPN